jgi:catechol 2,3-dioxygenase-like lactoylglutathione lyase family enzyme
MTPPVRHITRTASNVEESSHWYQKLLGEVEVVKGEGPGLTH